MPGEVQAMNEDVTSYNAKQSDDHRALCDLLSRELDARLPGAESKLWHGHPVWFLDGNPIAGYSRQKSGIRLMFWSGADFDEPGLDVLGGKFKDASAIFNAADEVKVTVLRRWIRKSREIQWDYKNIVKRKGKLERLRP